MSIAIDNIFVNSIDETYAALNTSDLFSDAMCLFVASTERRLTLYMREGTNDVHVEIMVSDIKPDIARDWRKIGQELCETSETLTLAEDTGIPKILRLKLKTDDSRMSAKILDDAYYDPDTHTRIATFTLLDAGFDMEKVDGMQNITVKLNKIA